MFNYLSSRNVPCGKCVIFVWSVNYCVEPYRLNKEIIRVVSILYYIFLFLQNLNKKFSNNTCFAYIQILMLYKIDEQSKPKNLKVFFIRYQILMLPSMTSHLPIKVVIYHFIWSFNIFRFFDQLRLRILFCPWGKIDKRGAERERGRNI